jgi:hypothetical protein
MDATIFKITEKRAHDRQNDSLKLAKQVNKLYGSYYRQGRMKNPLQKPYPRYYSYFTIRLMTKTMFNAELRGQGTPSGA